jgi:hypothetical protein
VADLLVQLEDHKEEFGITTYTILIEDLENTLRKRIEVEEDEL